MTSALVLVLVSMYGQMVHGFRTTADSASALDLSNGFVPHVPDKSDKLFWIDCATNQKDCHKKDDGSFEAYEPVWYFRLSRNGISEEEIEAYDEMIEERAKTAAPWEAERLDQEANGVTFLKECSRMGKKALEEDKEKDPSDFCVSKRRMDQAESIVGKYLPHDGFCLPDMHAYGIHKDQYEWSQSTTLYDLYQEDIKAATAILAKGIVDEVCIQVPMTPLVWPEDCVASVSNQLRVTSESKSYERLCRDKKSQLWQTEDERAALLSTPLSKSCRSKIGTFIGGSEEERAQEFAALGDAVRPTYCAAEEATVEPGCSPASDLQEELCARESLVAFGEQMMKVCQGDVTDFAGSPGTRPGYIVWQDAYLDAAKQVQARGVGRLRGADAERLKRCMTLHTRKLLSHSLAAFRCACQGPLPSIDKRKLVLALPSVGPRVDHVAAHPCFGIEGETSGVQLHTGQKPILQLVAESMCNPAYPLFQVTGDMGDDWKSMELITGPVPAKWPILKDVYTLYRWVFAAMVEFNGPLVTDGASKVAKKDRRHEGVPVISPDFLQLWEQRVVPMLLKEFTGDGLLKWVAGGSKLSWVVSGTSAQKGQGKPRIGQDYPVDVQRNSRDLDIGMQTTFELPLDFGSNWLSSVKPLFLGTREKDYVKVFVEAIHEIAEVLAVKLQEQEPELSPLLGGIHVGAPSSGIFKTILHYMAHYALVLASDDSDLALHGDNDIDITLLSCNVVRKNSFILNPRFGLKDLMEAFKDALRDDHMEALEALAISAFYALADDEARWSQLKLKMETVLLALAQKHQLGLPELCVVQEGLTSCSEFLGMAPNRYKTSTTSGARYVENRARYFGRLFLSLRQTVLAAGKKNFGVVRGCGHNIPPVFRQAGGLKFCRFEDRGQGRLAKLLDLSVDRKKHVVLPEDDDSIRKAFTKVSKSDFNPYEMAEKLLVAPVMESGKIPL